MRKAGIINRVSKKIGVPKVDVLVSVEQVLLAIRQEEAEDDNICFILPSKEYTNLLIRNDKPAEVITCDVNKFFTDTIITLGAVAFDCADPPEKPDAVFISWMSGNSTS